MELIYWSVYSYSRREEGGVKRRACGKSLFMLASYKFHFIRVHDDLVYDPSDDKSIVFANPSWLERDIIKVLMLENYIKHFSNLLS